MKQTGLLTFAHAAVLACSTLPPPQEEPQADDGWKDITLNDQKLPQDMAWVVRPAREGTLLHLFSLGDLGKVYLTEGPIGEREIAYEKQCSEKFNGELAKISHAIANHSAVVETELIQLRPNSMSATTINSALNVYEATADITLGQKIPLGVSAGTAASGGKYSIFYFKVEAEAELTDIGEECVKISSKPFMKGPKAEFISKVLIGRAILFSAEGRREEFGGRLNGGGIASASLQINYKKANIEFAQWGEIKNLNFDRVRSLLLEGREGDALEELGRDTSEPGYIARKSKPLERSR